MQFERREEKNATSDLESRVPSCPAAPRHNVSNSCYSSMLNSNGRSARAQMREHKHALYESVKPPTEFEQHSDNGVPYSDRPAGFGPGFKVAGGHDFVGDNYGPGKPLAPDDDPLDQCNGILLTIPQFWCALRYLSGHGTHVAGNHRRGSE